MNKKDIIDRIAEKADMSKEAAGRAYDAVIDVLKEAMVRGDRVQIVGFGTFEITEKAEREVRNPQTNTMMKVGPKKYPKFRAGKTLKDLINA